MVMCKKTNRENVVFVCSSLTFCENQSGGRPGSEKGLMALLTDTLEDREKYLKHKYWQKTTWKKIYEVAEEINEDRFKKPRVM